MIGRLTKLVYSIIAALSSCSKPLLAPHPSFEEAHTAECLAAFTTPSGPESLAPAVASCTRALGTVDECDPSTWMTAEAARCIGERSFAASARAGIEVTPVFLAHDGRMVWSLTGTWRGKPCVGNILQIDATDGTFVRATGFHVTHCE